MRTLLAFTFTFTFTFTAQAGKVAQRHKPTIEDAFARLDPGAEFYAVLDPAIETAVWSWLRKWDGPSKDFVGPFVTEIADTYTQTVGFDATAGWGPSGLDLSVPLVFARASLDDKAIAKAYAALTTERKRDAKTLAKLPRAYVGYRVVAAVADAKAVKKTIAALAGSEIGKGISFSLLEAGDAAAVGAAFHGDAKLGKTIAAALKAHKVIAVGAYHGDGDGVVLVRLEGAWLTLDFVDVFGGLDLDWKLDKAGLVKHLTRKAGGAAKVLATPSGKALAAARFGIWFDPVALLNAGLIHGRSNVAKGVFHAVDDADAKTVLTAGEAEVALCDEFRELAMTGAFADAAIVLRASPTAFELSTVWGLRPGTALIAALATADDGLLDPNAAGEAIAAGTVYLNGTALLRALPRPGVFARSTSDIGNAADMCGAPGWIVAAGFGWPQLLGAVMDEEAARGGASQLLVDNLRNLAGVVRRVEGPDFTTSPSLALASFDPAVGRKLFDALAPDFGKVSEQTAAKTKLLVAKPQQKGQPLLFASIASAPVVTGVALGGSAVLDWFFGLPAAKAAKGAPPWIALGRVDVPKLLRQFAKTMPYFEPYVQDALKRLGNLSTSLAVDGDLLVGTLRIEVK